MGTLWIGSHMCATQLKRLPGKSFIPRRWVPIFREKFSLKRVWCLKQLLVGLRNLLRGKFCSFEGQVISKGFLVSSISSKKQTKTGRLVVKTNPFARLLEEFTA